MDVSTKSKNATAHKKTKVSRPRRVARNEAGAGGAVIGAAPPSSVMMLLTCSAPRRGEGCGLRLMRTDPVVRAVGWLEGNFPGSPVQLKVRFVLRDGLIAALEIAP